MGYVHMLCCDTCNNFVRGLAGEKRILLLNRAIRMNGWFGRDGKHWCWDCIRQKKHLDKKEK